MRKDELRSLNRSYKKRGRLCCREEQDCVLLHLSYHLYRRNRELTVQLSCMVDLAVADVARERGCGVAPASCSN
jgi:hypothetical protein